MIYLRVQVGNCVLIKVSLSIRACLLFAAEVRHIASGMIPHICRDTLLADGENMCEHAQQVHATITSQLNDVCLCEQQPTVSQRGIEKVSKLEGGIWRQWVQNNLLV